MPDYGLSDEPAATERADEAVTIAGYATRVEDAASIEQVSEAYVSKYGEGFPDLGRRIAIGRPGTVGP